MAGSRCLRGGRQITTPRHSVPLHAEVVYVCIGRGATVGVWSIGFGVGVGGGRSGGKCLASCWDSGDGSVGAQDFGGVGHERGLSI